jgi:hypothetical protein
MIPAYARVSTDSQSIDAQVKQLRAAGVENGPASPPSEATTALRAVSIHVEVLAILRDADKT